MAELIINNISYQLTDGSAIAPPCLKAGVPFNCHTGVCCSCLIEIIDGQGNLSDPTPDEKQLGLDATHRLACQCRILSGTVRVRSCDQWNS